MTIMLILNAVLALAIVTAVVSLLGWGIVSDRARVGAIRRHATRRARHHASARPAYAEHRSFGREPELSS
jgi:hypothetical protein